MLMAPSSVGSMTSKILLSVIDILGRVARVVNTRQLSDNIVALYRSLAYHWIFSDGRLQEAIQEKTPRHRSIGS
jgi:hypothetical protein